MPNVQQRPPSHSPPPVSVIPPSALPQPHWLGNFSPSLIAQPHTALYPKTFGHSTGSFPPRQNTRDSLFPSNDLGESLQLLTIALPKRSPFSSIWNDSGVRRVQPGNDNLKPFRPFGSGENEEHVDHLQNFNLAAGYLGGSLTDYSSDTPRTVPAMAMEPSRLPVPKYNFYLPRVNNPSFVPLSAPPPSDATLVASVTDLGLADTPLAVLPVVASAPVISAPATVVTPGAATTSPVKAKTNATVRAPQPPGLYPARAQAYWLQRQGSPQAAPHALPTSAHLADKASSEHHPGPPLSRHRHRKHTSMFTKDIVVSLPRNLGSARPANDFHFKDMMLLRDFESQTPQHKEYCSTFYKRNSHGYMFVREPANSLKVNSNGVGSKSWVQLKVKLPAKASTTTTTTTTTTTSNASNTLTSTVTTSTSRSIKVDVRRLPHWKPAASAKTKRSRWRELLGSTSRDVGRRAKRTRP